MWLRDNGERGGRAARTRGRRRRGAGRGRHRTGLLILVLRLTGSKPGASREASPPRLVAVCFVVSIVAALGLFVVYAAGGQTQARGCPALPDPRRHRRRPAAVGQAADGRHRGRDPIPAPRPAQPPRSETRGRDGAGGRRRDHDAGPSCRGCLLGAAGALGLAALFPIRSLGEAPGDSPFFTDWKAGTRLVDVDGERRRRATRSRPTRSRRSSPKGSSGSADSQAVLIRCRRTMLQLPPDRAAGAPDGLVVLLEDLHARGLPAGAVPGAGPRAALPVPPVHVRRAGRREAGVRAGSARRCPSCRSRSTTTASSAPTATSPSRSARASGTCELSDRPAGGRRARRTARRYVVRPAQPAARSSPTTGRSCSASSRCTASCC